MEGVDKLGWVEWGISMEGGELGRVRGQGVREKGGR